MSVTQASETKVKTALLEGNLRSFVLFRLFYTARFYYPVFTVLFLDYGLSLEQFAILNLVWALTIVLAEVPSGAMADIVGRKRLVVFAAGLMVLEMLFVVLAPIGSSPLLFWMFLGNRVCSGLSEAAASGADEALAYDSLKALGREGEWSRLLEHMNIVVSIGFFSTMILGAFAYDPAIVNRALSWLNQQWLLEPNTVLRLPVLLTLATAVLVLVIALGFYDIDAERVSEKDGAASLLKSFRQIGEAACWTFNHRFVLFVILAGMALDSVSRQFAVLSSEYYRLIDIPVSWFGFIGAGMSLIGIVNARIAGYLVNHNAPFLNFLMLSAVLMIGLLGLCLAIPVFGVLFAVGAFAMMGMVQFHASFYLNREADSAMRATVLSFKGLALNLGLGAASLLYTACVAALRGAASVEFSGEALEDAVFLQSLYAFPLYYLVLFVTLIMLARPLVGNCALFLQRPGAR